MSKDPFIHQKMITYLGNKRKLIPEIEKIVRSISKGKKLTIFDLTVKLFYAYYPYS